MHKIIHQRNHQHTSKHDNSPVHTIRRHRFGDREADKDTDEADVDESEEVDGQAETAEGPLGFGEGLAFEAFEGDAADGDGVGGH